MVLNGPNMDQLGLREPETYGFRTYQDLIALCEHEGTTRGWSVSCRQSAHEGELVDWIHESGRESDALIINAAAYTHTSVALRDALACLKIPIIEIHVSNPNAREEFRRQNLLSAVVTATIAGFGLDGYEMAFSGADILLAEADNSSP
jgi:3-dehydroquinate dehydratase-2